MSYLIYIYYLATLIMDINAAKIAKVNQYIQIRSNVSGQEKQLATFFTPNGFIKDTEGKIHQGQQALIEYYLQPSPALISQGEPVMLQDGRVMFEFSVFKYWITWHIKAYFTMTLNELIEGVVLERQGLF